MSMLEKNSNVKALTLRACGSAYLLFSLIGGIPLTLSLLLALKEPSFWQPVGIFFFALVISFLWLRSVRLELTDDTIRYSTLFRRSSSLSLHEIHKAEIKAGLGNYSDRFRPTVRLVIEPFPFVRKPPMVVNVKVFSRRDIHLLLDVLQRGKTP